MLETWFSPPSVFGPSQILPSKPTSLSRDSSHGPLPGFQRTHPDQDFFCIGPSSRMRMTPAEPFSPSKRVNQSVTTYHSCSCADGARRRRVSLRLPPHVVYAGLRAPVLVDARHPRLFPCGTAAPDPADSIATLARLPSCKGGSHSQTRGPAFKQATSPGPGDLRNSFHRLPLVLERVAALGCWIFRRHTLGLNRR